MKCSAGASVLMSKFDGLVLKLCIDKFAKYDLQQKAKGKIQKLDSGIEEKTRMFNEYVTDIVLYKPDESWVLVIVHFVDGSERWGTIKNERYKKSELRQDDLFDKVKYTGWLVNNDSHRFYYDKESRLFSELKYG